MLIRKYCEPDLPAIGKIDSFFATLAIKYHKGINDENIVCAIDDSERLIGFGYLELHENIDPGRKQEIVFFIRLNESYQEDMEIKGMLMDGLIGRFNELKDAFPDRKWYLRVCCETNDIKEMQFCLNKGFGMRYTIPVLKYDLAKKIKHYEIPGNVSINEFSFAKSSMIEYLNADLTANNFSDLGRMPFLQSEANLRFMTGAPGFKCFAATCNSKLVGTISVWNISNEQAATENIFVIPSFRRKNIARELISTAFEELKNRGFSIATLSLLGTNLPAMKLYLSCGYSLYYNLIEMIYE